MSDPPSARSITEGDALDWRPMPTSTESILPTALVWKSSTDMTCEWRKQCHSLPIFSITDGMHFFARMYLFFLFSGSSVNDINALPLYAAPST